MSRYSTIYDAADLRLHPDGTRIPLTKANYHPRNASKTSRNAKGSWIAKDAGGRHRLPKRNIGKGKAFDDEHCEEIDVGTAGDEDGEHQDASKKKSRKRRTEELKDSRAIKRRKFLQDMSFLGTNSIQVDSRLDLPSSDLLKCVHFMASQFYAERGLLVGPSQKRKAKKTDMDSNVGGRQGNGTRSEGVTDEQSSGSEGERESESSDGSSTPLDGNSKVRTRDSMRRKNMYKRMDGSALLCIGMIIQEHVRELMNRPPPEGWEEMIANINMEDEDDWVPIPDDEGEWQVGSDQMSVISEGSVDQAVVGDNVIVLGEDSDSDSAASQDTPLQNLLPPEEHASIRHTRSKSQQKRPGSPEAGQEVDQPRVQASSKGRKTCDECKKKKVKCDSDKIASGTCSPCSIGGIICSLRA